jgi:hypothetical protein
LILTTDRNLLYLHPVDRELFAAVPRGVSRFAGPSESEPDKGAFMFRFERTATVKHGAEIPAAVKFASEITEYLNKRHGLNLRYGVELFGAPRIHWYYDLESLDQSAKLDAALLKDADYEKLLKKNEDLWVDESMCDTVVRLS